LNRFSRSLHVRVKKFWKNGSIFHMFHRVGKMMTEMRKGSAAEGGVGPILPTLGVGDRTAGKFLLVGEYTKKYL
jgi:hypothetical protein